MDNDLAGALVLINTEAGEVLNVLNSLEDIDSVNEVEVITGDYDIMAILRSASLHERSRVLIEEIRDIDGVKDTTSYYFVSLRRVRREHL